MRTNDVNNAPSPKQILPPPNIPLKPPQTKIIGVNFGARRILSLCLKTELNSVFGGGVGTCLINYPLKPPKLNKMVLILEIDAF